MSGFGNVLSDWHFWVVIVGYYIVMSVISGMPEPMPGGSRGYQWAYSSLHIFAANISNVVKTVRSNGGNRPNGV